MFDLLLRNGKIVDGTGNPWYYGDVAVKDGRITAVGRIDAETTASRVIDLHRQYAVSPGFIDGHCHSDLMILDNPRCEIKLRQGVTSEVVGNCGLAPSPSVPAADAMLRQYLEPVLGRYHQQWPWPTIGRYLDAVDAVRPSGNLRTFAAHGSIRASVMGFDQRPAEPAELDRMKELLRTSMQEGAIGMSLGLIYAPGRYADERELVELCRVLAETGGLLSVHMRGEGAKLLPAVQEMIDLAETTGVPLQISHLKAAGKANWGIAADAIERIEQARSRGVDITCDVYPYTAGATTLTTLLPPWALAGGVTDALERMRDASARRRMIADMRSAGEGWDNLVVASGWENVYISSVRTAGNKPAEGKYVLELSERRGVEPEAYVLDLLLEESGEVAIVFFLMDEREVDHVIQWAGSLVASDSLHCQTGKPHPRLFGCFPKLLARSVREQRLLTLEQAVRKITSFPAQRFRMSGRGLVQEGCVADLTIFDPDTIADRATYDDPQQYPDGIMHVAVQGRLTVCDGHHTGAACGIAIR
ncbi:N-acyl-D-amino-acid deacylase family protein [Paenibacillus cymbidii]|uniref:N-acyl-D-amino-acid deacylase family protein n=1 Tax=Paenibacillus cymbidii TaxID=1639034 RepID=UPI0010810173|nr:D-aminoacylase [Paenibacillus cymbidii]